MTDTTLTIEFQRALKLFYTISKLLGLPFDKNSEEKKNKCVNKIIISGYISIFIVGFLYSINVILLISLRRSEKTIGALALNYLFMYFSNIFSLLSINWKKRNVQLLLNRLCNLDNLLVEKRRSYLYKCSRTHCMIYLATALIFNVVISCTNSSTGNFDIFSSILHMSSNVFSAGLGLQLSVLVRMIQMRYAECAQIMDQLTNKTHRLGNHATRNVHVISSHLDCINVLKFMCTELFECVQLYNSIFGFTIIMISLHMFVLEVNCLDLIIYSFRVYNLSNCHLYVNTVFALSVGFPALLIIGYFSALCHRTSEEVTKIVVKIHKVLIYSDVGHGDTRDLKMLLKRLRDMKLHFTACGLFTVNLRYLGTFISGVIMYLLILIQIK